MTLSPADEHRLTRLRRMKAVALGLLVLAAVIYLVTLNLDHSGGWGYVNTMAEAAMVGALADWFAVTALFRHPLGIPIPHTAIIPRKKDELAGSLQSFFADNFLTEDVVRERIGEAKLGRRLGGWLRQEDHARRVVDALQQQERFVGVGRKLGVLAVAVLVEGFDGATERLAPELRRVFQIIDLAVEHVGRDAAMVHRPARVSSPCAASPRRRRGVSAWSRGGSRRAAVRPASPRARRRACCT